MSYVLADSTGPLEEFASIGGLADFTAWAHGMSEPLPSFVRNGYTEDIDDLLTVLETATPPQTVVEQVDAMRLAAFDAEDILIISDGMSDGELETLGGTGSGNFGHAGRPGAVGGSGGLKVYHGTSEEALRAIRKEGLVPHGSKGGDAWAVSVGRGDPDEVAQDYLSETELNGRRASVFVAERKETAESFAEYAARMHPGSEAAVIEVTIPESELGRLKEDELSHERRFEGRIPPSWITSAQVFHPTPTSRHDPTYPIADQKSSYKIYGYDNMADTHKLYFVLLVNGQRALGGSGSGNFGHAGRPGEVGGSASGSLEGVGGNLEASAQMIAASVSGLTESDRVQLIRNVDQLKRSAAQAGVPPNKVRILDEKRSFTQGGQVFDELGHYNPHDDEIVFNARPLAAESTVNTEIAFAHEGTHREWKQFSNLLDGPTGPSPEAQAAAKTLIHDRIQLAKDDGITPYSQAYWRDYQRDLHSANADPEVINNSFLRAANETLAEISANEIRRAFGRTPGTPGYLQNYDPTPIWRQLHSNIKAAVKHG